MWVLLLKGGLKPGGREADWWCMGFQRDGHLKDKIDRLFQSQTGAEAVKLILSAVAVSSEEMASSLPTLRLVDQPTSTNPLNMQKKLNRIKLKATCNMASRVQAIQLLLSAASPATNSHPGPERCLALWRVVLFFCCSSIPSDPTLRFLVCQWQRLAKSANRS